MLGGKITFEIYVCVNKWVCQNLTSLPVFQTPGIQRWIPPTERTLRYGLSMLSHTLNSTVETNKHNKNMNDKFWGWYIIIISWLTSWFEWFLWFIGLMSNIFLRLKSIFCSTTGCQDGIIQVTPYFSPDGWNSLECKERSVCHACLCMHQAHPSSSNKSWQTDLTLERKPQWCIRFFYVSVNCLNERGEGKKRSLLNDASRKDDSGKTRGTAFREEGRYCFFLAAYASQLSVLKEADRGVVVPAGAKSMSGWKTVSSLFR